MAEFRVRWEIDEYASTPRRAAQQARNIMRDAVSVADVFDVENARTGRITRVDFHAAEFGEKLEATIRRNGRSFDLTSDQIDTMHRALRTALNLGSLTRKRKERARELLEKFSARG